MIYNIRRNKKIGDKKCYVKKKKNINSLRRIVIE